MVAVLLIAWEPLRFAIEALTVLPTIAHRGALSAIELFCHGGVAAFCAAAGVNLWNWSPDGRKLGTIAVIAAVVRTIQSLYWSVLPNNTVPGDEPLVASVAVIAGLGAIVAIRKAAVRQA